MDHSEQQSIRIAGLVGAVGGVLSLVTGAYVQGVVAPASDVSVDMWSYPWSSSALVPVSLVYAVMHGLVLVGILGFSRSGVAGAGRGARVGTMLALVGTAVFVLAELLSIPVAGQRMDDTGASLVGATFGLGSLLSGIGFVLAGIATVRARHWDGWRRFVPLATGLWLAALVGLAMTPVLPVAVAVYGVFIAALGLALWTRPAPSPARPRGQAVQV